MTSARKPSGWFKSNYDKIIMVAVLLALLASAGALVLQLQSNARSLDRADLEASAPIRVVSIDITPLEALSDAMARPYQIPVAQRRMLVGDQRVSSIPHGLPIPFDALVCPFTGTNQPPMVSERDADGDGMPDEWEIKYGFNPMDPSDAQADFDNDGFSNLEEFQAGSDPANPEDFPPPSAKLRLVRVQVNPFKLRFLGTSRLPNGEVVYQLNLRTLERTYFARMNMEVEGFTVTRYDENAAEGPTLTVQHGDQIRPLVQGRVQDAQAYTALMIFLLDKSRHRANIGETITLIDRDYKVVDIKEDRVVIRDEESAREIEVGPLSDEERRKLSAAGRAGAGL